MPPSGTPNLRFCLYDASGNAQPLKTSSIPAGGMCDSKPCWKTLGTKGYGYMKKSGLPDGIATAKLTVGAKTKIKIGGKGLALSPLPLSPTLPLTVQLLIGDALSNECWEVTYGTATRNDTTKFAAMGP
jgi:hypothetical protein